jgi:hypothetical protein
MNNLFTHNTENIEFLDELQDSPFDSFDSAVLPNMHERGMTLDSDLDKSKESCKNSPDNTNQDKSSCECYFWLKS